MHAEHYKAADIRRLANEWFRDDHYVCQDGRIDASRSKANYCMDAGIKQTGMKARTARTLCAAVMQRVEQVAPKRRKDANVLTSWTITCPQELKGDKGKEERFFAAAYDFMKQRYGEDNVLQGVVHYDETTPHMHCLVVPVATVDGNEKLSSKALWTRKELSQIHTDIDRRMEQEFGLRGLMRNGRTKGNLDFRELRERTAKEQELTDRETAVVQQEQQAAAIRRQAEMLRQDALQEKAAGFKAGYDEAMRVMAPVEDMKLEAWLQRKAPAMYGQYQREVAAVNARARTARDKLGNTLEQVERNRRAQEREYGEGYTGKW